MPKVFFYLGANIHQEALEYIESGSDVALLYDNSPDIHELPSFERLYLSKRALCIDPLQRKEGSYLEHRYFLDQRESIISKVLNDCKNFLLRTRVLRFDFEGSFQGLTYFSDLVDYAINLTGGTRPDLVFCAYTPHTIEAWITIRTLEELGARIVRLTASPLPWVSLPISGTKNASNCNLVVHDALIRDSAIDEYLRKLRSDYSNAIPYYERRQAKYILGTLIEIWKSASVRALWKNFERRLALRELRAAESKIEIGERYAVYFLHYQPEMNTLPEADIYCDQFHAIKKLAETLPTGFVLRVKEHPSTFAKHCDRRWRPSGFYQRILSLQNVRLCPLESNTFDLIDKSLFVASIAGVCLTEALARRKPIVFFYSPRFAGFSAPFLIDGNNCDIWQLKDFVESLCAGEIYVDDDAVRDLLQHVMRMGYDGSDGVKFIPTSATEAGFMSKRANLLAIRHVLDGKL